MIEDYMAAAEHQNQNLELNLATYQTHSLHPSYTNGSKVAVGHHSTSAKPVRHQNWLDQKDTRTDRQLEKTTANYMPATTLAEIEDLLCLEAQKSA